MIYMVENTFSNKFYLGIKIGYLQSHNKENYMELIEIVYNGLIIVAGLLILVVLLSYLISKSRARKNADYNYELQSKVSFVNNSQGNKNDFNNYQLNLPPVLQNYSKIQTEQIHNPNKSLKIIKELSFNKNEYENYDEWVKDKKNKKRSRYTIINEEIKKTKKSVVNFYL